MSFKVTHNVFLVGTLMCLLRQVSSLKAQLICSSHYSVSKFLQKVRRFHNSIGFHGPLRVSHLLILAKAISSIFLIVKMLSFQHTAKEFTCQSDRDKKKVIHMQK